MAEQMRERWGSDRAFLPVSLGLGPWTGLTSMGGWVS